MFKLFNSTFDENYLGEVLVVVYLVDVFREGIEFYVVGFFDSLDLAGQWVDNFYYGDLHKVLESFHDEGVKDGEHYLTLHYQDDYIIAEDFLGFQDKLLANGLYRLSWSCYEDNVFCFSTKYFDDCVEDELPESKGFKVQPKKRGMGSSSLKKKLF